jgi:hypothetical protein
MNKIGTFEASKILGINHTSMSLFTKYCESFPKPDVIGRNLSHDKELIEKWMQTHDVKNELRYAYRRKNKVYEATAFEYRHPVIDQKILLHIKKFLRCDYTRWRKFENRDLFADYLLSEKTQQKLNFSRRIGL